MHKTFGAFERPLYDWFQVCFPPPYQIAISSNKWNVHEQFDGMESQVVLYRINKKKVFYKTLIAKNGNCHEELETINVLYKIVHNLNCGVYLELCL